MDSGGSSPGGGGASSLRRSSRRSRTGSENNHATSSAAGSPKKASALSSSENPPNPEQPQKTPEKSKLDSVAESLEQASIDSSINDEQTKSLRGKVIKKWNLPVSVNLGCFVTFLLVQTLRQDTEEYSTNMDIGSTERLRKKVGISNNANNCASCISQHLLGGPVLKMSKSCE